MATSVKTDNEKAAKFHCKLTKKGSGKRIVEREEEKEKHC
jgi:hypothetical protein